MTVVYFTPDDHEPIIDPAIPEGWELVVGCEVHCELSTETKLFCGCQNKFGEEPNHNICPVCLGLPGSMPSVNAAAVEYAMRLGLALNAEVQGSVFSRKNYFYPDMPKDYQTTQFDLPTNVGGHLDLPNGVRVHLERAHIEEDTGKSTHIGGSGRIHDATHSLVDYNRAGVPLVEIVSRPDIHRIEDAKAYASELRAILLAIDVCDAKMEEGSMRVDANVSVRPLGSNELRTRCEVKNINSIRSLGRAIEYEANRHIDLYNSGESPNQETRHWDEAGGRSISGRSKEDSDDYRYFVEPDLVPLVPTDEEVQHIRDTMPMLPAARRTRLLDASSADPEAVDLVVGRGQDGLAFEVIAGGGNGNSVVKHLTNNLADGIGQMSIESFVALLQMETAGDLSSTQTKTVLADLVASGGNPTEIAASHGFEAMDNSELEGILDQLIAENPDEWARFAEGDRKVQGFFVGKIMKATRGQADGKVVNQLMQSKVG